MTHEHGAADGIGARRAQRGAGRSRLGGVG